uniref:Uncharacterized protein n=1 Tax=Oryza rufipogon TaxID=4529 RepID=A0A0E0PM49_ORYRU
MVPTVAVDRQLKLQQQQRQRRRCWARSLLPRASEPRRIFSSKLQRHQLALLDGVIQIKEHLRSEVTSVGLVVRAYGSNQARGNEMLDNDMLMNSLFYGDQLQQGVVPAMDRTKMRMLLILSVTSTQYRLKTLTVILPPIR